MDIKKEIEKLIENSLKNLEVKISDKIKITHPDFLEHGDFTFNVLPFAKKSGKNPREFAEQIRASAKQNSTENIESIEIAGAGFLNFFLSKKFYKNFLLQPEIKNLDILKNKKYLSEKVSPNMFKPFHIGHTVGITYGESLTRIFKFCGAETTSISYPSDVSLGIAKAVWSLFDENKSKNFSIEDMGKAYARGTNEYENSEKIKKTIIDINKNIYIEKKDEYYKIYKEGVEKNLEYFKKIAKRLGTEFQDFIFESEAGKEGLPIVKKNTGTIFEKSNGAVIYDGEKKGLHTRVFINSEKLPTYETKDVGLISLKFKKFDFDKSFVYTDMEQQKYFEVVKMAIGEVNNKWAEKSEYLQYGRLNFIGGKISSRYGNVPLAEDLIDLVKKNILEVIKEKDFSKEYKEEISEKVAIGALKYSFLKVTMGKNMIFDFEKSLDFSGNSGPYLQYSYVRAKSILNKVQDIDIKIGEKKGEVSDLEKKLYRFTEVVEKSLFEYSPHHLANYLYDLAKEFNSFYAGTKVLDKQNSDYFYNLILIEKFSQIMKKGLELLGIETVEKM